MRNFIRGYEISLWNTRKKSHRIWFTQDVYDQEIHLRNNQIEIWIDAEIWGKSTDENILVIRACESTEIHSTD